MRIQLPAVTLLLGLVASVSAVASVSSEEHWFLNLLGIAPDASSKAGRQSIARALAQDLLELERSSLDYLGKEARKEGLDSPKGEAWKSKAMSFSTSTEYQLESFHNGLAHILEALDCVLDSNSSISRELYCWAYTNWALTDSGIYNDGIYYLHQNNAIDFSPEIREQFFLDGAQDDPWGWYHMLGRAIQEHIVLPLIRATRSDTYCTLLRRERGCKFSMSDIG
jgi:hypothetical protein